MFIPNIPAALAGISFLLFTSCTSLRQWAQLPKKEPTPTPEPAPVVEPVKDSIHTADNFLENLLAQYPEHFKDVLEKRNELNVQVIYTQVDRGANGIPALKHHYFNVDSNRYFYPASTVKLPVALLALQRLNELKDKNINKYSTLLTEKALSRQTAVLNDPTTPDGRPSIAHYIKKILMVSDNDAYNRLYEFLGRGYINKELQKKGYTEVQLLHRLQVFLSQEENRHTNPVQFVDSRNKLLYYQPMQYDTNTYAARTDSIGQAYYRGDSLVQQPMNFSQRNKIYLESLHHILISLVFPNKVYASQRFNLTEDDRNFVLKYMSQLPTESTWPPYSDEPEKYYPAYCKFLLHGADKGELPKNIRIFNKVGDAYGHLLDVAYIVDFEKKVEFFVSAVIYCNSDGVLNDDKYDYDSIGFPFLKNLGQVLYDYEMKREKKHVPDLQALKFLYDNP
ncbi:MAG TPA: serine hydrolase [Ferruginibacter sp.]|nr:serine hydrolase [Ferruginibacter sp.]HMP20488.1 serine hydrolase [Ferruginibacter sp.]